MNNTSNVNEILKLVEHYGFKFYAYDENNNILVTAPNEQIIPLSLAHKFVLEQAAKLTSMGGSPESMPQMPVMPSMDSKMEKSFEKEKSVDNVKAQQGQPSTNSSFQVQNKAPQVEVKAKVELENPFDSVFKLSFNPANVAQTEEFVKSNSSKSTDESSKWLAAFFAKWLAQQKAEK